MLETLPQWILFLIFVGFGTLAGAILGIFLCMTTLLGNKKFIQITSDILSILGISILYIVIINIFNWGEQRLFLLIAYILGIILERKTIGKLFAKLYRKLYNHIVHKLKIVSNSKFGTMIRR